MANGWNEVGNMDVRKMGLMLEWAHPDLGWVPAWRQPVATVREARLAEREWKRQHPGVKTRLVRRSGSWPVSMAGHLRRTGG